MAMSGDGRWGRWQMEKLETSECSSRHFYLPGTFPPHPLPNLTLLTLHNPAQAKSFCTVKPSRTLPQPQAALGAYLVIPKPDYLLTYMLVSLCPWFSMSAVHLEVELAHSPTWKALPWFSTAARIENHCNWESLHYTVSSSRTNISSNFSFISI